MKKLFALLLVLALLAPPAYLYAAAATITSREQISLGNFAAVSGIVTITSGDTIATGLSSIIYFTLSQNPATGTNPSANDFSYTASGGTVTVRTESNALRYRFFAIGGP